MLHGDGPWWLPVCDHRPQPLPGSLGERRVKARAEKRHAHLACDRLDGEIAFQTEIRRIGKGADIRKTPVDIDDEHAHFPRQFDRKEVQLADAGAQGRRLVVADVAENGAKIVSRATLRCNSA